MEGRIDDPLGLPVKSKKGSTLICISEGETVYNDLFADSLHMEFRLKGDTLFLSLKNLATSETIIGQYYVPSVSGTSFNVTYDPETFDGIVRPYSYYVPIRVGTWAFIKEGIKPTYKVYHNRFDPEPYDINCFAKKAGILRG